MKEKINFTTSDGVKIVGDYYNSERQDAPAALLLHMMPATKESWEDFALRLQEAGFRALAIDLRGHGESLEKDGQRLDFREFSDEEHRNSYKDVEAAIQYLKEQGSKEFILVGASIGANLAIWFEADHPEIKAAIPLSAGYNYKGIGTKLLIQKMQPEQQIYFVGASGDLCSAPSNCGQTAEELYGLKSGKKKIKVYDNSRAHGTELFKEYPDLLDILIEWLKNIFK